MKRKQIDTAVVSQNTSADIFISSRGAGHEGEAQLS
jgi:hypothetical protein